MFVSGVGGAKPWYQDAARTYLSGCGRMSSHFGGMGVFFERLSRSMLPSAGEKPFPGTFFFDEDRLGCVRSDILDAINLDVCMRMYEDLERVSRLQSPPACLGAVPDDHEFNFSGRPSANSRPSSSALSSRSSIFSSQPSSLVLPLYLASDTDESKSRARNLRDTLLALLQQASPDLHYHDRW
jgi:hypothetical protein